LLLKQVGVIPENAVFPAMLSVPLALVIRLLTFSQVQANQLIPEQKLLLLESILYN
jgi:hypothetical protein